MGWILMLLLLVLVGFAGWTVGVSKRPSVQAEARTFGLEEARSARLFIQTPEQAKAVKAVVVGVLNFEDTVAEEAEDAADELLQEQGLNERRIDGCLEDIVELNAKIASLQAVNLKIGTERSDLEKLSRLFA